MWSAVTTRLTILFLLRLPERLFLSQEANSVVTGKYLKEIASCSCYHVSQNCVKFSNTKREFLESLSWPFPLGSVVSKGHRGFLSSACRFQCSRCYRSWTSAQVKIVCHMFQDAGKTQGRVLMRIFGQRCQKCFGSQFESPEFSTESIERMLNNLVNYILQRYYGHRKIASILNASLDEKVLLDGPHDTLNCEACSLHPHGRCAVAQRVRPPRSPSPSPSPSPKSHSSSPSRSHPPLLQTEITGFRNRPFQEVREPGEAASPLLVILSVAALALIGFFIR